MGPFEMVVGIVLIVTIGKVLHARFGTKGQALTFAEDLEGARLRDEVKALKERVAVLERIATDKDHFLEQEFERLRDR